MYSITITQQRLIDDWTEYLLYRYFFELGCSVYVPIPVIDIAERLFGLRCEVEALRGKYRRVAGFLQPSRRKILLNRSQPFTRIVFTQAHELAHWLLHVQKDSFWAESMGDLPKLLFKTARSREAAADYLASALLMPRSLILHARSTAPNRDARELAKQFGVSQEAMGRRIETLEQFRSAPNERGHDQGLSAYASLGADAGYSIPFPKGESTLFLVVSSTVADHQLARRLRLLKTGFRWLFIVSNQSDADIFQEWPWVDGVVLAKDLSSPELDPVLKALVKGPATVSRLGGEKWIEWARTTYNSSSHDASPIILTRSDDRRISYRQTLLPSLGPVIESAVPLNNRQAATRFIREARRSGKRVVVATGCFDLITSGHVRFLRRAKAAGDLLVVGVEDDVRVRAFKGDGRPLNAISQRVEVLQEFSRIVDFVFVIRGAPVTPLKEFYSKLHQALKPDFLAVTEGDPHLADRKAEIELAGGELIVVSKLEETSTTSIIRRSLVQAKALPALSRSVKPVLLLPARRHATLEQIQLPLRATDINANDDPPNTRGEYVPRSILVRDDEVRLEL
jgi:D-glycero-beta-D-manno-heptose 1-phosphate adenylyltransferase